MATGPDSARHGSSADGSQSFMRTPVQSGWAVQHDASQNPYGAAHATPQQRMDPFKPDPIFSFGTAPDARFSPPAFQNHFGWPSAYDATQNPSHGGPTATSAPVSGPYQYQYQQQHWSPGGHATPSTYNPAKLHFTVASTHQRDTCILHAGGRPGRRGRRVRAVQGSVGFSRLHSRSPVGYPDRIPVPVL